MSERRPPWYGKGYSFFTNRDCEYFPCHPVPEGGEFNCLFCYCPLYMLGRECGGSYTYLPDGTKDCSRCQIPHRRENYGYITGKYRQIAAAMAAAEKEREEDETKRSGGR